MGVIYVAVALFVIITHIGLLSGVLATIFAEAFDLYYQNHRRCRYASAYGSHVGFQSS